jgi:hypothetical protein
MATCRGFNTAMDMDIMVCPNRVSLSNAVDLFLSELSG